MDIDIDLDQFDGLVDGIDAAELAVRAAAAGRLEAIYALHQALHPPTGIPRPATRWSPRRC